LRVVVSLLSAGRSARGITHIPVMRRRASVVCPVAAVLVFGVATAVGQPHARPAGLINPVVPPLTISWADRHHRYGWVIDSSPWRCTPKGQRHFAPKLCGTDDRGRHWRIVLTDIDEFGAYPKSYLRWSKDAGVVARCGHGCIMIWTRDGGRTWWTTRTFEPGAIWNELGFIAAPPMLSVGSEQGSRVLDYTYDGKARYHVTGWVPALPMRCSAGAWEPVGPKGRRNCRIPLTADGMTAQQVP
jgi:hypothetical protein